MKKLIEWLKGLPWAKAAKAAAQIIIPAAVGSGAAILSGCSDLRPQAKTQTMSLYAIGIPGIARPLAVTSLRSCAQSPCSLRGFPPKRSFFGTYRHAVHSGRRQPGRRREQAGSAQSAIGESAGEVVGG